LTAFSFKECIEYQSKGKPIVKFGGLSVIGKPSSIANTCLRSTGLIFGGKKALRGEFPHAVALVEPNGGVFCGGSLISERFVLTAVHCKKTRF
jgi:hypothetical protein